MIPVYHCYHDGRRILRRFYLVAAVVLTALLLTACGTSAFPVKPDANDERAIEQRQAQFRKLQHWQLSGRVAMITSEESWSGQLYWQQGPTDFLIHFSAPSGQGAMQLSGDEHGVELRLANGDTYQAEDANSLLRQETTWDLPIDALWYWIRGLPDPAMPVKVKLDPQGLITDLTQKEWRIQYNRYEQYDRYYFPRKIVISNRDTKLKLIVTHWEVS
ncbi:MAG: lipoprotein insertase outer membrane protein LolB [Gammaproteobacteria bacterium]|jgi:outer membrane lipoprotein LolB